MSNMRRTKRLVALAAGLSLVAAACGGDDDEPAATEAPDGTEAAAETTTGATEAPADTEASGDTTGDTEAASEGTGAAGDAAMTLTIDINPDAVWDDGTPITFADFECTSDAILNTPGSSATAGYDKITSVERG